MSMVGSKPSTAMSTISQTSKLADVFPTQIIERPATSSVAGYTVADTLSTVFLPTVAHNHLTGSTCPVESPFGLQIAALHQVLPGEAPAHDSQPLTEAESLVLRGEPFPTLMEALEASGACWARVRLGWLWIQPNPPPSDYYWDFHYDEKLRLVSETGVHLIATVDDIPGWAADSPCGLIYPERLDEFAQFLTDLVNHYKQPPYNIHHWELFNEPDGTWPDFVDRGLGCWGFYGDQYAQMLAVAYPAIKAADPEATVLMGGVAYDWFTEYGGPFYRYFPDDVMAAGGSDNLDVLNLHYFPDFHSEWERWDPNSEERRKGWLPAPTCGDVFDDQGTAYEAGGIDVIAKVSHFRNRLRTCFGVDKPVWVTELGEHGRPGDPVSLAQQARYVIQGNARALAAGVDNITWFALVSPPYDTAGQGLLYKDDWSPKPAFYAYQTLTSELMGYTYAYTLDVPNVEGYIFRDPYQREKTVAWGLVEPEGDDSVPLVFAPASRLRVADHQGNVTFVEDGGTGDADGMRNGAVELQLTADPVIISQKEEPPSGLPLDEPLVEETF
jgi:hypothetical protein